MKINFAEYDFTEFAIKEGAFGGIWSKLITPIHIGTKFTQRNKVFRSSIWVADTGELLSAGLPKFVNFGENPENFPIPLSIDNCAFVEKIDGSLVCLDYINDKLCMRTRGTFSYESLENASDFEDCLSEHLVMNDWLATHSHCTLLCELTTPNLKVVLDYGPLPQFWLVGVVNKNDYSLMSQHELDALGKELGLKRPESFSFSSIDELLNGVAKWTTKEGICLYSNNSREIHKIKAYSYLKLHRFKENATLENTLELFFEYGQPSYQEFERQLQLQFDHECWGMVRGYASNICDAAKQVHQITDGIDAFVDGTLRPLPTRRAQAEKVLASYSTTNRSAMVFTRLDGKQLSDDQVKKLFWQVLKK